MNARTEEKGDDARAAAMTDIVTDLLSNFSTSFDLDRELGTSTPGAPDLIPTHESFSCSNVSSDGKMSLNSNQPRVSECLNTTDIYQPSSYCLAPQPSWSTPLELHNNSNSSSSRTLMQQQVNKQPEVGGASFPFPVVAQQDQQQQDLLRNVEYLFANVGQLPRFEFSERELKDLMRSYSCTDIMEESTPSSPITLTPNDHVTCGQPITAFPLARPLSSGNDLNDQVTSTTSFDHHQQHLQQPIGALAADHVSRWQPITGPVTTIPLSVSCMDVNEDSSDSQQQSVDDNDASVDTSPRPAISASRSRTRSRAKRSRSEGDRGDLLLYRFCCDLLRDPLAYKDLIHWENEKLGVFRIVQAKSVAYLWGLKKDKTNMTYDKMSRSFRYCRDVGYFDEIPKYGVYKSTRLLFKFGERATNWRTLSALSAQ